MTDVTASAAILAGGQVRRFGDPDRLLANVNTPADYADLEALQAHKL
jgi:molybdopterin-guanine dinucleotide biosynthesis protein A